MDFNTSLTPFELSALNVYSLASGIYDGYLNSNLIKISDQLLLQAKQAEDNGSCSKSSYYLELRHSVLEGISGLTIEA